MRDLEFGLVSAQLLFHLLLCFGPAQVDSVHRRQHEVTSFVKHLHLFLVFEAFHSLQMLWGGSNPLFTAALVLTANFFVDEGVDRGHFFLIFVIHIEVLELRLYHDLV